MKLTPRKRLGKYRIERKLASGGFADVYQALDTMEGIPVALKVPHQDLVTKDTLQSFRREVRLTATLDHPNILPIKTADVVDGVFLVATPLGKETLNDRLQRRLSIRLALSFSEQLLEALAFAHQRKIAHCDLKPENMIMFPGERLRLADFGIAKVILKTVRASGSGTVGYMAPEQAMGKPSLRSDVFSAALIIYRLISGKLPEWPYAWPPPGHDRFRRRVSPELGEVLRKAMAVDAEARYPEAGQLLKAFRKVRGRALQPGPVRKKTATRKTTRGSDWKTVRRRQFTREFGKVLEARHLCSSCRGPVSEAMKTCPWCGKARQTHPGPTTFPARCPRCRRGVKLDWLYCAWCYGGKVGPLSDRSYQDRRYVNACRGPRCTRRELMPGMPYCPWCRAKVTRKWKLPGSSRSCPGCGWGIAADYWDHCPWCARVLRRGQGSAKS